MAQWLISESFCVVTNGAPALRVKEVEGQESEISRLWRDKDGSYSSNPKGFIQ